MPLRNCPPWHTTRVDYTTHPWHLLCNAIDNQFEFPTFRMTNVQSVVDALYYVCNRFNCECSAKLQKIIETKAFTNWYFRWNNVFRAKQYQWWQETTDKMAIPLCVGIETTSFRPRRTERRNYGMIIVFSRNGRCRKQRFLHDSIRKGTRNSVAKSKPQGEKVETMYPNWFQQVSINGNNAKVPWRIFWRKWRGVFIVFIIKT